jgi:WD40 repeat protein/DNA-binding SARP family transcriptional activator
MLQVRLLGQFDVRVDSRPAVISSRAGQSLLAYLMVTAGTPHRREKLAGLFWPDTSDENARTRLRHELWRVRKAISAATAAADFILADELTITFNPEAEYSLDVAQLERELASDDSLDERVRQAGLYHGELLPGFYDEWIVLERARVQAVFERRMQQLLECLIAESRWKMTIEWSEHWLAFGEMPEPAYRAMMLAYSALGDRSKVAATYDRCVALLAQELDVAPSEETTSLRDRLLRGEGVAHVDLSATHVAAAQSRSFDEPPTPGEPPFKGLQAFEEADADRFFGRELLTAQLIGRLRESRFLAVIVGASGSGKSSIVRAGLIPQLKRGELLADGTLPPDGSVHWQVHVITPTAHPLEALAVSLTRGTESVTAATTLAEDLARDARSLRFFVRRALEASASAQHVLLVVDQFEELFTLCRNEFEREAFIDNLIAALEPDAGGGLTLVLTLRADFYAHLASYPELRDAVARQQEYIGPMTAEELRRAIEEPARRGGWDFQPGLVDVLLRDVGDEPGALPLLSHALLETWQRRSGRTLTLQGYAETGGVHGAIAHTAETVYQSLSPEQQYLARHIFLRLTELGEGTEDTRRRASLQELMAQPDQAGEVRAVLNILAQARLITLSEETAEVAHEALIRAWPTLREWLDADREGLLLHRHLTEAAYDWELLERDPGALYRGARLAQAAEWAAANPNALNVLEQAFLTASQEQEQHEAVEWEVQRQRELETARKLAETERARADEQTRSANRLRTRNRIIAAAGGVALLLALLAAVFGTQANQSAARADQNAAQAQSNLIAAEAESNRANKERDTAVAAQATAQAETIIRATAQAQAEHQSLVASVRELAGAANFNLEVDPERSLLLAQEAVKLTDAAGQAPLLAAQDALHRAVQASRLRRTLHGHTREIMGLGRSPDEARFATISDDGTLKIWETVSGQELLTIPTGITVTNIDRSLAFSPDGQLVAAPAGPALGKIWDAATGRELLSLAGHSDEVTAVVFSPDGTRLATSSLDDTARLWDAGTGRELQTFSGHAGDVNEVIFSPDGERLATASSDRTIKIWDVVSGQPLFTLSEPDLVWSLAYSPDGTRLAAGGSSTWSLWDAATGQNLLTVPGHASLVTSVVFDSTGQRLATASSDGTARLWDTAGGRELLALAGHTSGIQGTAFAANDAQLLTTGRDMTIKTWDISPRASSEWFNLVGHSDRVYDVAYDPTGKLIATAGVDGRVKLWDAATGQETRTLNISDDGVWSVAFSPDGQRLFAGSSDFTQGLTWSVWDVATGENILTIPCECDWLALSEDGSHVATSSGTTNIAKLWDAATGLELFTLTAPAGANSQWVTFSPDGTRVAVANTDGVIRIWDVATGKQLLALNGHNGNVFRVAFSPDGRLIATSGNDAMIRMWDAASGAQLYTLTGHTGPTFGVNFGPDGRYLATSSVDRTIKLWEVAAGASASPLTLGGHAAAIYNIVFSPDGSRLATASRDRTSRVYALNIDDLMQIAQSRVTRSLTEAECQAYLHLEQCP